MKSLPPSALDALAQQALQSPRRRANLNLHDSLDAPVGVADTAPWAVDTADTLGLLAWYGRAGVGAAWRK